MNSFSSAIVGKALAGLIVLVPFAILLIAGIEIWGLLEDMAAIAKLQLPLHPIVNALIFIALILASLFILCLLTGLLMSTSSGKRLGQFLQKTIADKIPLLGLVRNLTMSLTGTGNAQVKPAEVDLHGTGTCIYGFLMEELPDGRMAVFIPSAPAVTIGQLYIMPPDRVKLLDASMASVVNAITQWGTGATEIYAPEE